MPHVEPILKHLGSCECPIPTWTPLVHGRHRSPHTLHVGAVLEVQGRYMLGTIMHNVGDPPLACLPSLFVRHFRPNP
jgi:hypothetical protein